MWLSSDPPSREGIWMGVLAGILSGSGTYVFSIDHPWDLSVGMAAVMALAVGSTWGWITAWRFRTGQT